MTAGGVEQYVILAFSSKEGQEKCTSFAILSLTLGPGDAYDPAALGRLGPGGAMTLRSARGLVALAVVFASIGAGFWLHAIWTTRRGPEPSVAHPLNTADALQAAFVTVAERVRPAVVHIGTVQVARARRPSASPGPFADDPLLKEFFDQFFGPRSPGNRGEFHQPGLGSGVIVDSRGYVLTNFHVIKGADGVIVRLSSKREYRGRIVGTDAKTDLAVVRFEPETEVTVATLGNSDALRVGEWAVAIGNPFGLDQTVTVGVVSATGRADVGIASYENFIQTDASINPGNSGGPLLNRGKVTRGWLGVAVQPLTPELAQALGMKLAKGAVVSRVYPSSPAAAAELHQNDVILTFDGVTVEDYNHLHRLAAETEVGRTVKLGIVRDKQSRTVDLKVSEAPDTPTAGR